MENLEPGDRVAIFHYTHPNPDQSLLWQCVHDPFSLAPAEGLNKLQIWHDWPVVVLTPPDHTGWLTVTSAEFIGTLRTKGKRVPLTHCELLQKAYGLPPEESEEQPTLSPAPTLTVEQLEIREEVPPLVHLPVEASRRSAAIAMSAVRSVLTLGGATPDDENHEAEEGSRLREWQRAKEAYYLRLMGRFMMGTRCPQPVRSAEIARLQAMREEVLAELEAIGDTHNAS